MADAFAMQRLKMPPQPSPLRHTKGVREIGWAEFGEMARGLASRIGAVYAPDVVLGIANGGVFVGGALAPHLQADFHPIRVEKRKGLPGARPVPGEKVPDLGGKRVLVVDDLCQSGGTLEAARAMARRAGAAEVRDAVLVRRPLGARPDFHAVETSDVIVFGWDYQLHSGSTHGSGDPGDVGV